MGKKLCAGNDCFKLIDMREFPMGDVHLRADGTPHPFSLLCEDCITPAQRKSLKRYRKALRHKNNVRARTSEASATR